MKNWYQWVLTQPCPRCGQEGAVMERVTAHAVECYRCGWTLGMGFLINYFRHRHIWVGDLAGGPLEPLAGLPMDQWAEIVTVDFTQPVWIPMPLFEGGEQVGTRLEQTTLPARHYGGGDLVIPIHRGRPVYVRDEGDWPLPRAGRHAHENWHFAWQGDLHPEDGLPVFVHTRTTEAGGRDLYGRVQITAQTVANTRNRQGAFAAAIEAETQAMHREEHARANRLFYEDGAFPPVPQMVAQAGAAQEARRLADMQAQYNALQAQMLDHLQHMTTPQMVIPAPLGTLTPDGYTPTPPTVNAQDRQNAEAWGLLGPTAQPPTDEGDI